MPPLEKLVIDGTYFKNLTQEEMWEKIAHDLQQLQPGDIILLNSTGGHYELYKEARQYVTCLAAAHGYLLRFAKQRDVGFAQAAIGGMLKYDADQDAYRYVPKRT